jgi:V8-like Glu-specific endopeptidase
MNQSKIKYLIVALVMVCLTACATFTIPTPVPTNINNNPISFQVDEIRKSVVKISTYNEIRIKNRRTDIVRTTSISSAGTGSVIRVFDGQTFILTAGHICNISMKEVISKFPDAADKNNTVDIRTMLSATTYTGDSLTGIKLLVNDSTDLCLAVFENSKLPELQLSPKHPRLGDRVTYSGYPRALWSYGYIPSFAGTYAGMMVDDGFASYVYTIPSTFGCSGSPVFNENGEVIGTISGYLNDFNSLSFGSTLDQIREILNAGFGHYEKYRAGIKRFFKKVS